GHEYVAAHRHREAELVAFRRVRGHQFLPLAPDSAAALKNIDRALMDARCAIVARADDDRLAAYRHPETELTLLISIQRHQFLPLAPDPVAAGKDISRAL